MSRHRPKPGRGPERLLLEATATLRDDHYAASAHVPTDAEIAWRRNQLRLLLSDPAMYHRLNSAKSPPDSH